MAIAEIAGILSALNAARQIGKTMLDIREMTLFQENLIKLNGEILNAQDKALSAREAQTALVDEIRDLKKQISGMEAWQTEKEKYGLKEIASGVMVFAIKEPTNPLEPLHYLCTNCYHDSRKSILQQETRFPGRSQVLVCHRCSLEVYTIGTRHAEHSPRRK